MRLSGTASRRPRGRTGHLAQPESAFDRAGYEPGHGTGAGRAARVAHVLVSRRCDSNTTRPVLASAVDHRRGPPFIASGVIVTDVVPLPDSSSIATASPRFRRGGLPGRLSGRCHRGHGPPAPHRAERPAVDQTRVTELGTPQAEGSVAGRRALTVSPRLPAPRATSPWRRSDRRRRCSTERPSRPRERRTPARSKGPGTRASAHGGRRRRSR
jgi:hypothetical protein